MRIEVILLRNNGNYFIMNKLMDYKQGYGENIKYLRPGITIDDTNKKEGWFISKVFDSREKLTNWQQLLMDGNILSEASVSVYIYSSESEYMIYNEKNMKIENVIRDVAIGMDEKKILFEKFYNDKITNPKDVLLHHIKGRYLWILVHLKTQGEDNPEISKIKLVFPKKSLMYFLPEVYQENTKSASFLERYLEIFETLYSDINDNISKFPEYLDPDSVPREFLSWLAEWIAIEDIFLWNEEQLRYLIKNGLRLYKIRGTKQYLKEMVQLYTGKEPYIIEYFDITKYKNDGNTIDNMFELYSDSEFVFTVIVDLGHKISNMEYQTLTRIINISKPAHMGCKLVVLEPYIYLGKHSYLGINSVLGDFGIPVLDNQQALAFIKLQKNDERTEE